jgi:hypothetical protein
MAKKNQVQRYLLCIKNEAYPASLELRKVYRALPDRAAKARNFVRVIDESGEDYLFPADCFVQVTLNKLPEEARTHLFAGVS